MKFFRNIAIAALVAVQAGIARITNRYEGATRSSTRSNIPGAVQSARFDANWGTRMELVRKARYFERNSAIVNRMADIFESYVVGPGVQVTPSSSDSAWNAKAKQKFDRWCETADLSSNFPLSCMDSLAARAWFVDGQVFMLLAEDDRRRPAVQLIESHLICTPPSLAHLEGNTIVDGHVVDKNGRTIAYYIASEDAKGNKTWGAPTPAEFVIHIGEPSRPGMKHALPFLYPVINQLHDKDDLQILEMRAAKEAARHINFIKNKAGEISPAMLEQARYGTSRTLSTGTAVTEERRKFYADAVGGETIIGQSGDELERLSSDRPSVVTREYWKGLDADICAGTGISYVLVYPESMQGTVYRGALDMSDAFFRARFATYEPACRRRYRHWAQWARYAEPELRDAPGDWDACTVHPPRSVNVDIGYNSAAAISEVQSGLSNYNILYSRQGYDWREQMTQLKEQQDFARSIGLQIVFPNQPQPAAAQTKPAPGPVPDPEEEPVTK